LRGISLKGEPDKYIVVNKNLPSFSIAALVFGAGYLWVGDSVTDEIYRVDPRTSEVDPFTLKQSPDVLVITRVNPTTGHSLPSVTISGDLHEMAIGGGYVWVTDASANGIQRVAEDLGSAATPIPVGQIGGSPKAIAYDDGAILVGFTGGTLAKINPSNPSSPAVIWMRPAGVEVSSITVDRGTVLGAGGPLEDV
jgi:streptogramin lyase